MKWLRKSDSCAAFVMDCIESHYDSVLPKRNSEKHTGSTVSYIIYGFRVIMLILHILTTMVSATDEKISIGYGQEYVWKGIRFKVKKGELKKERTNHYGEIYL